MVQLSEKAIRKVTGQIFETMLFVFSEEPDAKPAEHSVRRATINYVGPFEGTIILRMPDTIVPTMTRSMLGEDEGYEPSADEENDMLGEMANIISGNVLNALTDDQTVFGLRAPIVTNEINTQDIKDSEQTKHVWFNFEDGWAEVIVKIRS